MATMKIWPIKSHLKYLVEYVSNDKKTNVSLAESFDLESSDNQFNSLANEINYITDSEKVFADNERFVTGIECDPMYAVREFNLVKNQFGETDGIIAWHGEMSFKEGEISPRLAHQIGVEFAQKLWGDRFQVVVSTHLNTKHIHNHFLINSVSYVDGKRIHDETTWFKFRKQVDDICIKYGVSVVEEPERGKITSYQMHQREMEGEPTKYVLMRDAIDDAISNSFTISQFESHLNDSGYTCRFGYNLKYWSLKPSVGGKAVRIHRLGENYSKEAIIERLNEKQRSLPKDIAFVKNERRENTRQYPFPKRDIRIKKRHRGIEGLYLHYCYLLGALPRRKYQSKRVPPEIRQALVKLDMYRDAGAFLRMNHIETLEQLDAFHNSISAQMESTVHLRKQCYNRLSRVKNTSDDVQEYQGMIHDLNDTLKTLRKNDKICDFIKSETPYMLQVISELEHKSPVLMPKTEERKIEHGRRN